VGRREPPPRKPREVHVRFESSHLVEDCLADAYERLVPILRRQLIPAPALQPVDTPHLNRSTIRRRQSGRVYPLPSTPGSLQTNKRTLTPSPANWPHSGRE